MLSWYITAFLIELEHAMYQIEQNQFSTLNQILYWMNFSRKSRLHEVFPLDHAYWAHCHVINLPGHLEVDMKFIKHRGWGLNIEVKCTVKWPKSSAFVFCIPPRDVLGLCSRYSSTVVPKWHVVLVCEVVLAAGGFIKIMERAEKGEWFLWSNKPTLHRNYSQPCI